MDSTLVGIMIASALFVVIAAFIVRRTHLSESTTQSAEPPEPQAQDTDATAGPAAPTDVPPGEPPPRTLHDGLDKTRTDGFIARIGRLFTRSASTKDVLDELEEVLLTADIGVRTAARLFASVREALSGDELLDPVRTWAVLRAEATTILEDAATAGASDALVTSPHVVMVLGVNGSGKTTTIGKLASRHREAGRKVTLVAGDTFRAAAAEQLELWGRRVGSTVARGKEGADPASVVFDGLRAGIEEAADVILVDTAGRLHTQANLMDELAKVRRVMGKAIEGAPHEVLLVVDATTGQNAIQQAKSFKETTDVTGIVLTKLDGTAKGGVVIGVCDELKIPIRFIGVGERIEDLRPFVVDAFLDALFEPSVDTPGPPLSA